MSGGRPSSAFLALLLLHLLAPARSAHAHAATSPVRYRIEASVDRNVVTGTARIEIDPVGAAKMDEVVLFLFPNLLSERLPGENAKSFYTIHPHRFRKGGMQLVSLQDAEGNDLPWTGVEMERPDGRGGAHRLPEGTAIRATLPASAEGTVTVVARFVTTVPERFGTFSWYREELLLNGGWHPLAAPRDEAGRWDVGGTLPRADFDVVIDVPRDRWVVLDKVVSDAERKTAAAPRRTVETTVESRPGVVLLVSDRLLESEHPAEDPDVELFQPRRARVYGKRERRIGSQACVFLEERGLREAGAEPVTMLESALSRELTFHDVPVALISRRTYRVFPPMRKYHDVHVARGVIAAAMRDRVYELEPGEDAGWVLDAVAWYLAKRWEAQKFEGLRDVRDYAKPLAFIPAVNLVLNTPDFPFAAEYYDTWYFTDVVRDDPSRFNHLRPNGRVVYEKLVDRLGPETAAALMEEYLRASPEDGGFRAVATREAKRDLESLFEVWRAPLPRVNYRLRKVKTERLPTGGWASRFTMEREGDPVEEPVSLRALAKGGHGRGVWNPGTDPDTVLVMTKEEPRGWEVDWRNRLIETERRDNRVPPVWQFLLQYFYVDYEFKLNRAEGGFAFQFERSNDLRTQIEMVGFTRQQSAGAAIGYVKSTGRATNYRGLLHRFGFFVLAEDLSENFGTTTRGAVPGFDPAASKVDQTAGLQINYRYDDREDWRFPRTGTRVFAAIESGTGLQGSTEIYNLAQIEATRLVRLSDNNVLALQGKAGTFFATDAANVPLSKLFYLGGTEDVRGISAPDIVGPTKTVLSAEWRHYWLHDIDWDFYIERMRGLQGSLFVDTGYISARPGDAPPINDWVTSVGYGFREHYDFLGVRPMLLRFDIAQRVDNLDRTKKADLRFYIGAGQSF